jgi:hypothetical protein
MTDERHHDRGAGELTDVDPEPEVDGRRQGHDVEFTG